jgi:hypothetical protein
MNFIAFSLSIVDKKQGVGLVNDVVGVFTFWLSIPRTDAVWSMDTRCIDLLNVYVIYVKTIFSSLSVFSFVFQNFLLYIFSKRPFSISASVFDIITSSSFHYSQNLFLSLVFLFFISSPLPFSSTPLVHKRQKPHWCN